MTVSCYTPHLLLYIPAYYIMLFLLNFLFVLFLFRPLAQDEDFKRNKCVQTDNYRVAPIVVRRLKATQTDIPDPATLRKVVDSVTIEVQTDDVPELLRAAIVYAEKITQTQSKPLEISEEEKYCQLIEYYKDIAIQTVESKFAPWTASHTIEEPPPCPPSPPPPRTPTPPPPVVQIDPMETELENLRAELNEDLVFDPLKFRKRMMSLAESSSPLKETDKKTNKGEVEPKDEAKPKPVPVPPSAPMAPNDQPKDILVSGTKSATAVPKVQKQESVEIDQLFEIVEEEPVFDPSQYKKRFSGLTKTETLPPPISEVKPTLNQQPSPEVQRQESAESSQIFNTEEDSVFDPSKYLKKVSIQPQSEAQASITEPKSNTTQQSDHVDTSKPPTEIQSQVSEGLDQIFDIEEPVFDPSQYMKCSSASPKAETQSPSVTESIPTTSQQSSPKMQRQQSAGFDQIFDNSEGESVFDPSRYMKRFSALHLSTNQH